MTDYSAGLFSLYILLIPRFAISILDPTPVKSYYNVGTTVYWYKTSIVCYAPY